MSEAIGRYTITLDDDPSIHKLIARITDLSSLPFTSPDKLMARSKSYAPLAVSGLYTEFDLDVSS